MLIISNVLQTSDNIFQRLKGRIKTTGFSHSGYGKTGEYQLFWLEALFLTWEQQLKKNASLHQRANSFMCLL